jgi:aspartate aminotransferase
MPSISDRAKLMPSSPIRKLVPFADAAKARGTHIYHLNIGQPDIETPPEWWQAIEDAHLKVLAYSHSQGIAPLRNSISAYYQRLRYDIKADDIIVTTGASEALNFIFASCMNPGDEVIIPEPFYANYNGFSIASNVKVVPITTQIENDFALPEMEAFEKLITPRTKAIMICNPGNPTGVVYPREALMKLREIVLKHDLYLIADEVYREFVYDGEKHASVLGMEGLNDNVIVVDSVSKRFSACGARIGAVISRNEKVMGAIMKLAQARLSPPTLGQLGAQAAYGLPQSYYDGVISEYKNRRDFLKKALEAIPGVLCPQVNGAFYAIVRLPVDDTEKFCRWMLESFSHEGSTVMMAPAAGFYASDGLGRDEVRIAYVLNTEALEKAMICLAEGLKAYQAEMMMKQ